MTHKTRNRTRVVAVARPRPSRRPRAEDRSALRFAAFAILGVVAFFILTRIPLVSAHVVYPYTAFITDCSRRVLRLLGHDVGGSGLVIAGPSFSVMVQNVCNGLEVTGIFLAAVLAFPTSWKNRLTGIIMGYPVILLLNIARIAALYILGYRIPNIFESVHRYYAQALVIIVTLAVWVFWVARFTDYGAKAHRRVSS